MNDSSLSAKDLFERIGLALLFAAIGSLIIIVFSQYRPMLSGLNDFIGRISLMFILLMAALLARRSILFKKYWQLLFGLFIMALAVSLDWWIARFMLDSLAVNTNTPAVIAFMKLKTGITVVVVVLLFTRISGSSLGSIYIQKGNLKQGLTIGLIAFGIAAAGAIPISELMFVGGDLTLAKVLPWMPWILIFVLANASNEELLFRGLFLRKLEPFYGRFFSNCLIALVFTGLHVGTTYPKNQMMFLMILLPLALAWGYITQKTDSVWGSILFHAGMDIPIILGTLSTL
jgi:membrane protease YdiL (CAAX protease family)